MLEVIQGGTEACAELRQGSPLSPRHVPFLALLHVGCRYTQDSVRFSRQDCTLHSPCVDRLPSRLDVVDAAVYQQVLDWLSEARWYPG